MYETYWKNYLKIFFKKLFFEFMSFNFFSLPLFLQIFTQFYFVWRKTIGGKLHNANFPSEKKTLPTWKIILQSSCFLSRLKCRLLRIRNMSRHFNLSSSLTSVFVAHSFVKETTEKVRIKIFCFPWILIR